MAGEAIGGAIAGFVIVFMIFWIMLVILGILGFIFWIFMIVDIAKRRFKPENDKVMWILIVIFTGIIGALIYYFMVKRKNPIRQKKEG